MSQSTATTTTTNTKSTTPTTLRTTTKSKKRAKKSPREATSWKQQLQATSTDTNPSIKGDFELIDSSPGANSNNNNNNDNSNKICGINDDDTTDTRTREIGRDLKVSSATGERVSLSSVQTALLPAQRTSQHLLLGAQQTGEPHRKLIDSPDCVRGTHITAEGFGVEKEKEKEKEEEEEEARGALGAKANVELNNNNILSPVGPVVVATAFKASRMNTSENSSNKNSNSKSSATSGIGGNSSTGKGQKFIESASDAIGENNNNSENHKSLNQTRSSSSSPSNATTATSVSLSLNTIESLNSRESIERNNQLVDIHSGSKQKNQAVETNHRHQPSLNYTSIFMQQKQQQQQQNQHQPPVGAMSAQRGNQTTTKAQATGGQPIRGPLRKQYAQTDIDEAVVSASKMTLVGAAAGQGGSKKLAAFNFRSDSTMKVPLEEYYDDDRDSQDDDDDDDDEEEEEDDDVTEEDELSPFSKNSIQKQKQKQKQKEATGSSNKRRISPESNKQQSADHRRGGNNLHKANINNNPNSKISFGSTNQPPSFNTCQQNAAGVYSSPSCHVDIPFPNRKLDWILETPGCAKCSCNNCYKKRKLIMSENNNLHPHLYASHSPLTYNSDRFPKTRTMHLVLKSIILILLTLLLLMILVGALMASHFLPQALERALNASRSFNVTIAG